MFFDADGALVGFGGYKGPPHGGEVEIGYAIAPERQNRGLATAAVRVFVERARLAGVERVIAHTLPDPVARRQKRREVPYEGDVQVLSSSE